MRNDNTAFISDDVTRGYTQKAAFGSVDFDLVPERLTLTLGTRYYKFDNTEVKSAVSSFGCYVGYATTTPCTTSTDSINLNAGRSAQYLLGIQEPRQLEL